MNSNFVIWAFPADLACRIKINLDTYTAKYDANGNVLWAKDMEAPGNTSGYGAIGFAVSADTLGNIYVSGGFTSPTLTFDTYTFTPPTGSTDPMFIVKYDANGNVLCASVLASGGDDLSGVSTDRFGNAYIGGDFEPNPFFVGSTTLTLTGEENIFVAKWAPDCTTAGIEQIISNNEQVNIYPNPNNGSFVIEPQNTMYNVHCTMYDVNGKNVLSQIINGKTTIDASTLYEGVYNISLQSNEGVVNKRLVIVR